jgi:ketosteroid isomerase-like protein
MTTDCPTRTEHDQILDHIHEIFHAYLNKDRKTIRRTHTEDWRGFQVKSREMVRGIEGYMRNADRTLENTTPLDYELIDTDVTVHGDIAIVYYLASYRYLDKAGEEHTVGLRSTDIYRKDADGWNQCGSNICTIPPVDNGAARDPAQAWTLPDADREVLLAARRAVWEAWFTGDAARIGRAIPDDAIAIDPGDEPWADKPEIVRRATEFAASGAKLIRLEFPRTEIQAIGSVAILYTTYLFETESADGERRTSSGRGTEIFVSRNGEWLNSGWHLDSGR